MFKNLFFVTETQEKKVECLSLMSLLGKSGIYLRGLLIRNLATNIRPGSKAANLNVNDIKKKSFKTLTPGANVIKL
jgi:hypothetical protein